MRSVQVILFLRHGQGFGALLKDTSSELPMSWLVMLEEVVGTVCSL